MPPLPKPEKRGRKPRKPLRRKRRTRAAIMWDEADDLFRHWVWEVGHCERCGTASNLQCAHIISREYRKIRCYRGNSVCLCAACHRRYTNRPVEWHLWVNEHLGEGYYERMERLAILELPLSNEQIAEESLNAVRERRDPPWVWISPEPLTQHEIDRGREIAEEKGLTEGES